MHNPQTSNYLLEPILTSWIQNKLKNVVVLFSNANAQENMHWNDVLLYELLLYKLLSTFRIFQNTFQ